jgi:hypothetical protein
VRGEAGEGGEGGGAVEGEGGPFRIGDGALGRTLDILAAGLTDWDCIFGFGFGAGAGAGAAFREAILGARAGDGAGRVLREADFDVDAADGAA